MERFEDFKNYARGKKPYLNEDLALLYGQGEVPPMGSEFDANGEKHCIRELRAANGSVEKVKGNLYILNYQDKKNIFSSSRPRRSHTKNDKRIWYFL